MATLLETYQLQNNDQFQARVRVAALQACQAILGDTSRSSEYDFCRKALRSPMSNDWLSPIVFSVCLNPTIATNGIASTDGDITYVVNSIITAFTITG